MPLEDLVRTIETLRERTQKHSALLSGSEALTRYALIDPLLRALGWDTEDPKQVRPEYSTAHGRADYALMGSQTPAVMVEAKSLRKPLSEGLTQGINYCLQEGTRYFLVTDGQTWELYETHKPVPIEQKKLVAFDLQAMPPHEAALKALALWRPNSSPSAGLIPAEVPVLSRGSPAAAASSAPSSAPSPAAAPISVPDAGSASGAQIKRLPKSVLTPQRAYRRPILMALAERGGSAKLTDVKNDVGERMAGILTEADYTPVPSDPKTLRWSNNVGWERLDMVNAGLLKSDSPRGVWEITEAGRQWLKSNP